MALYKMKHLLFPFLLLLILSACTHKPQNQRAVYFWKTTLDLGEKDSLLLGHANIKTIYLRLFDLDYDANKQRVDIVAPLSFNKKPFAGITYIPVVYITNKALQNTESEKIPELAIHILKKVTSIFLKNEITFPELQIDCDWTESTREKYFRLLAIIKDALHKENKLLSATIRLHQVKYSHITGIPPVDRGMLMYYNMGKIAAGNSKNSIFNKADAEKYTPYISSYSLPLDLALPVFSWGIQTRRGRVVALLNNITLNDLGNDNFTPAHNHTFRAKKSFFYKGYYFIKDDIVKLEQIKPGDIKDASQLIKPYLKKKPFTITLYQYSALNANNYDKQKINKIYRYFD